MELIDRYVYAVTKRLPQKQRDDIEKELRTLIDDMLEERCEDREPQEEDIIAVLNELGDPAVLATKYRDDKSYLIGPEYFYTYIMVMKIVIIATAMGMGISHGIKLFIEQPQSMFAGVIEWFAAVISGVFQGFAWVTIIFAIMERINNKDIKNAVKRKWNVSELPKVPKKEELIKPSESIVGIVFTVIFMVVFCFASRYIGAYHIDGDGVKIIPVFSEQGLQSFLPIIIVLLCVSIVKESLKLIVGKWTLNLSITLTVLNVVLFIFSIVVFINPTIWNSNFIGDLTAAGMVPQDWDISFDQLYELFKKAFVAVLAFGYGLDSMVALIKGVKYGR
jgi:hypothetical protein